MFSGRRSPRPPTAKSADVKSYRPRMLPFIRHRPLQLVLIIVTILGVTYHLHPFERAGEDRITTETEWYGWPGQQDPRVEGHERRPSWGALKQQGARRLLRDNLREDRTYITTWPGLG